MSGILKVFLSTALVAGLGVQTVCAAAPVIDYPTVAAPAARPAAGVYAMAQKGLRYYANFPNVPDFMSYKHLENVYAIAYEPYEESFYYLESPGTDFLYMAQIFDYMGIEAARADDYKIYLQDLGFRTLPQLRDGVLWEYGDLIANELLYDPDFRLSEGGILVEDMQTDFTLVLIGTSVANGAAGKLGNCLEIRIYSLRHVVEEPESITSYVTGTGDRVRNTLGANTGQSNAGGTQVYYQVPDYSSYTKSVSQSTGTSVYYEAPDVSGYTKGASKSAGTSVYYEVPDVSGYTKGAPQSSGTSVYYEAPNVSGYMNNSRPSGTVLTGEVNDFMRKMETNLTKEP